MIQSSKQCAPEGGAHTVCVWRLNSQNPRAEGSPDLLHSRFIIMFLTRNTAIEGILLSSKGNPVGT